MENFDLWSQLAALGQVIAIDLVLAGDNAIVVGMAAAGVPLEQRRTSGALVPPSCCASSSR
jgi:predicted tellurium resistance membrane protein TerC